MSPIRIPLFLLLIAICSALASMSTAQCPEWQSGFGLPGTNNNVVSMCVFDDGTGAALYAGGGFTNVAGVSANRIAKWNGSSWTPLGSGLDDGVAALTTFDDGTGPSLYVGGVFTSAGGVSASYIARWDGAAWSAVGAGTDGPVFGLAVFDDALYAAGFFEHAGGVFARNVAKWNGTSWSEVGGGTDQSSNAMTVFDTGSGPELYVAGRFSHAGGVHANNIAKWNGSTWSALIDTGNGTDNQVYALAVFDDGAGPALYAGGGFGAVGQLNAHYIARWNGTSWSELGPSLDLPVNALAVFDDGGGPALIAGGWFTYAGNVNVEHIGKWNGTSWSALSSGTDDQVYSLAVFDDGASGTPNLYAGGFFKSAGGTPSLHIAKWTGCGHPGERMCFGDGSGGACPCGNNGMMGRGCENSAATGGALLDSSGWTSLAFDSLRLTGSSELPNALSIFLQGGVEISPTAFGDGLRCAGGSLKRLYVKNASAGIVFAPAVGDPSISSRSSALGDPIAVGTSRTYQVYYRDPDLAFCPAPLGNAWNVSSGLRIAWLQ